MEPLVTTEWLAGELGKPDLVVFDATKYLPNENKDGRAEFLRAHIPGARYFDIDEVADTDTDLPHMVPTPGRFAKLIGGMGVGNASRVVFYDQKGLASAARGWWLMGSVRPRPGRRARWRTAEMAARRPAQPKAASRRRRSRRCSGPTIALPGCVAWATCWAMSRHGRNWCWMRARAGRFTGAVPEPRAGMRSGHIPGSASLPYTDLLNADGTFRSPAAIRARLAQAGVDGSRPVVTSCGSGVTACILTLGLRLAGLPEGAVYDGSWTEWGGRADTPVETN